MASAWPGFHVHAQQFVLDEQREVRPALGQDDRSHVPSTVYEPALDGLDGCVAGFERDGRGNAPRAGDAACTRPPDLGHPCRYSEHAAHGHAVALSDGARADRSEEGIPPVASYEHLEVVVVRCPTYAARAARSPCRRRRSPEARSSSASTRAMAPPGPFERAEIGPVIGADLRLCRFPAGRLLCRGNLRFATGTRFCALRARPSEAHASSAATRAAAESRRGGHARGGDTPCEGPEGSRPSIGCSVPA